MKKNWSFTLLHFQASQTITEVKVFRGQFTATKKIFAHTDTLNFFCHWASSTKNEDKVLLPLEVTGKSVLTETNYEKRGLPSMFTMANREAQRETPLEKNSP